MRWRSGQRWQPDPLPHRRAADRVAHDGRRAAAGRLQAFHEMKPFEMEDAALVGDASLLTDDARRPAA